MAQSDSPELDSLLERKVGNFRRFAQHQKQVWDTVSSMYLVSRGLVAAVVRDRGISDVSTHRLMMWQTVLEYQMESFFLLIDTRLDAGLALLRMGAELARDTARISDNDALLSLWLDRSRGRAQRRAYRDTFRFVDSDRVEAYVHRLYELASEFGVHGHLSVNSGVQPFHVSPNGEFVALGVPDFEVYRALEIWFAAFFPLQDLCNRGFRTAARPATTLAAVHYDAVREAFESFFESYRRAVRQMSDESKKAN
jgi:hypothetical protein